jgi:hypothetical protein
MAPLEGTAQKKTLDRLQLTVWVVRARYKSMPEIFGFSFLLRDPLANPLTCFNPVYNCTFTLHYATEEMQLKQPVTFSLNRIFYFFKQIRVTLQNKEQCNYLL